MNEADRIAAAQRARKDAEARQAGAALFHEYGELARLKTAVPMALDAKARRNHEGVVEVRGTFRTWFWSTDKYFGAFELFSFGDDHPKRRITVYLASHGDIAYGDDESDGRVTVLRVAEYLNKVRKEVERHAAHLRTSPIFNAKTEKERAQHAEWYRTSSLRNAGDPAQELWTLTGLRKVVEAVERLGGGG